PSTNWRWTGSADAVWSGSGAWRAGAYATIVRTKVDVPTVVVGGGAPRRIRIHPYPVIKLYTQSMSLPQLLFFGIGPDTTLNDKSFFGERESVTGASVIWPITPNNNFDRLVLSLFGEANGRWVSIRSGPADDQPSIEQRYTNATAPALPSPPAFVRFRQCFRLSPSL